MPPKNSNNNNKGNNNKNGGGGGGGNNKKQGAGGGGGGSTFQLNVKSGGGGGNKSQNHVNIPPIEFNIHQLYSDLPPRDNATLFKVETDIAFSRQQMDVLLTPDIPFSEWEKDVLFSMMQQNKEFFILSSTKTTIYDLFNYVKDQCEGGKHQRNNGIEHVFAELESEFYMKRTDFDSVHRESRGKLQEIWNMLTNAMELDNDGKVSKTEFLWYFVFKAFKVMCYSYPAKPLPATKIHIPGIAGNKDQPPMEAYIGNDSSVFIKEFKDQLNRHIDTEVNRLRADIDNLIKSHKP